MDLNVPKRTDGAQEGTATPPSAGWYPDPGDGMIGSRWWDGSSWTDYRRERDSGRPDSRARWSRVPRRIRIVGIQLVAGGLVGLVALIVIASRPNAEARASKALELAKYEFGNPLAILDWTGKTIAGATCESSGEDEYSCAFVADDGDVGNYERYRIVDGDVAKLSNGGEGYGTPTDAAEATSRLEDSDENGFTYTCADATPNPYSGEAPRNGYDCRVVASNGDVATRRVAFNDDGTLYWDEFRVG